MSFSTRFVFLGIVVILIGLVLGVISSGRLTASAELATAIVAIAETIMAGALLLSTVIEV